MMHQWIPLISEVVALCQPISATEEYPNFFHNLSVTQHYRTRAGQKLDLLRFINCLLTGLIIL